MENAMHAESAIVKANGIEIAHDTFGDSLAPPLLLITGLSSQMVVWDEEFCTRLAAKGYFVIRFDNRDIGLSTKFDAAGVPNFRSLIDAQAKGEAPDVPYTLRDMADDTVGLLDALGIDCAHVAGISMGGMIGQMMAIHYPKRVCTLTSIMSSTGDPGLPPPNEEAMPVLFMPLPADRQGFIERFVDDWRVLSGPEFPIDDAYTLKWAEQSYNRGINPSGIARQYAAIIASGSRKKELKSIAVPTLVIHGDVDPLLPVECGIDTANIIPGARLLIIKGMGHALPPALWAQVIDAITNHAV